MKDWTGNKKTTFATLGASSHSDHEREAHDYYATEPDTIDALFEVENFEGEVWECACGEGHLSKRIEELGKKVMSTDLVDRGYGIGGVDFLTTDIKGINNIVSNPPYKFSQQFVETAIEKVNENGKVAMFLKLIFLEGQKRQKMFKKFPPKYVYVFSKRKKCALNGEFEKTGSSAAAYAWFVWYKGFEGDPIIKWI